MKRLMKVAAVLAAAVLGLASDGGKAQAGLKDVGPLIQTPADGPILFPSWYRDNTILPAYPSGIPLELCLTPAPCGLAAEPPFYDPLNPLSVKATVTNPEEPLGTFTGNFPGESFYYMAVATGNIGASGKIVFTAAIEAAFGGDGNPGVGMQFPFVRNRIDLTNVPDGTYTVRHPYGTRTLTTEAGRARYVTDIPLKFANPLSDTASTMTTFLLPSGIPGGEPLSSVKIGNETFIADPARVGAVTNGPFRNFVSVTGPGVNLTINDFSLLGKVTVFPAAATITPPGTLDFGLVEVGTTSAPQTFTVANTAQIPGSALTVEAPVSGDAQFKLQPNDTPGYCSPFPFSLAAGANCKFDVVFSPTSLNTQAGTLSVTTSAAATPTAFNLAGTGVAVPPTVTIAPTTASGIVGTPITFTAVGGGPGGAYDYRFLLSGDAGTTWSTTQDGASGTWAWNTLNATAGAYQVKVEIRPQGQPNVPAAASAVSNVTVVNFTAGLTASPASIPAGSPTPAVTFTATGADLPNLQYQFQLFINNAWQIVKPYSAVKTWTWNTTGIPAGTYQVRLDVQGAPAGTPAAQTTAAVGYTVAGPVAPVRAVRVVSAPTGPRPPGTIVNFTAAATGGAANYEYQYSIRTGGIWNVVQAWSSTPTFRWVSPNTAGAYLIRVESRAVGSSVVRAQQLTYRLR